MTTPPQKKILIVEDDLAIRRLLEVCLRQVAAGQVSVGDGEQALTVMHREKIDLVVTDLMMPGRDGFWVVNAMRADPGLSGIPVVMLSCLGDPDLPLRAGTVGVQACFVKPFSPSQLISAVRTLLAP